MISKHCCRPGHAFFFYILQAARQFCTENTETKTICALRHATMLVRLPGQFKCLLLHKWMNCFEANIYRRRKSSYNNNNSSKKWNWKQQCKKSRNNKKNTQICRIHKSRINARLKKKYSNITITNKKKWFKFIGIKEKFLLTNAVRVILIRRDVAKMTKFFFFF